MFTPSSLLAPLFRVTPRDLPPPTSDDGLPQERLQQVVYLVTHTCQRTLVTARLDRLQRHLDSYDEEVLGFAYEGAGVGLAAKDIAFGFGSRTREFVNGPAAPYKYAVYLGAGMGLARLHAPTTRFLRRLADPFHQWVVWDGYGFHEGLFAHTRHMQEQHIPVQVSGFARAAFDHGMGRALWFATGADVSRIAATIAAFDAPRRGDLWAGIGLACSYTGGVGLSQIQRLVHLSGQHQPRLAEGAAVAAKNRADVGNTSTASDATIELICGRPRVEVCSHADDALTDLDLTGPVPAYFVWRDRLASQWSRDLDLRRTA